MIEGCFWCLFVKKLMVIHLSGASPAILVNIKIGFMVAYFARMLTLLRKTATFVPNPSETRSG
jgi:flagellar biosynthesis protein FliQ